MLQAAILFQDHMILQRNKEIAVWGTAAPGSQITINMQGKNASTVTDEDGKWQANCGPFVTSFQEEMMIASDEEKLVLHDVQVGEVWLAGGQSNMEFHMRYDADMTTELVCLFHFKLPPKINKKIMRKSESGLAHSAARYICFTTGQKKFSRKFLKSCAGAVA